MQQIKETRGGKREGAGRPKLKETKRPVRYRVASHLLDEVDRQAAQRKEKPGTVHERALERGLAIKD